MAGSTPIGFAGQDTLRWFRKSGSLLVGVVALWGVAAAWSQGGSGGIDGLDPFMPTFHEKPPPQFEDDLLPYIEERPVQRSVPSGPNNGAGQLIRVAETFSVPGAELLDREEISAATSYDRAVKASISATDSRVPEPAVISLLLVGAMLMRPRR